MYLNMLKGKIHRATVVQAELDYVGSITVDSDFCLPRQGFWNTKKSRSWISTTESVLKTYTIAGEPGSGMICLNGARRAVCRRVIKSF